MFVGLQSGSFPRHHRRVQGGGFRVPVVRARGMGAGTVGQTALTLGTPLASGGAILGGAAASTAGITSASLRAAGLTAGIGIVAAGIALWLSRKGPAQNVATTHIVDEAEPLLKQNLAAWQSSNKTCADYLQTIANFQQVWNAVIQNCAQTSLGDPGHSCLDDRLPAGVKFNTGPPANFNINGNGNFDWFAWYLMPILNDPAAGGCCASPVYYDANGTASVPMPTCTPSAAGSIASLFGGAGGSFNLSSLLIPALLIGGAIWVMS